MIIRRKPLGSHNLRTPPSLGMALLRSGIARVQALTVRRTAQTDELIDWGNGVPDDMYAEQPDYDEADLVADNNTEGNADSSTFTDAITRAESLSGTVNRTTNTAGSSSQPNSQSARRRVQRRVEPATLAPRLAPPLPRPAAPSTLARQSLSDGDTMPDDLSFIVRRHRELGHLNEQNSGIVDANQSAQSEISSTTAATSAATKNKVARITDDIPVNTAADAPRLRRRSQIVDVTPPKRGLPFGDETTNENDTALSGANRSASPLGSPLDLTSNTIQRAIAAAEASPQPRALPFDNAGLDFDEADLDDAPFEADQTLTDFDTSALQAFAANSMIDTTPAPRQSELPTRRSADSTATTPYAANAVQRTVQPDSAPLQTSRQPAQNESADRTIGGDEVSDDEPAGSFNTPNNAYQSGLGDAIARAEQSAAPSESNAPNPSVASVNNAPSVSAVQRRAADNTPTSSQPRNVQDAIARAEQSATPSESGVTSPAVASNNAPSASAVQRRPADNVPTSAQPRTVQEAIARAEQSTAPSESGVTSPAVASNNAPPTSAVQRRPADNTPTSAQTRNVQEAIARAEQSAAPSESGVTSPAVASNNAPSASAVQRRPADNTPTSSQPRNVQEAIARAEQSTAPSESSTPNPTVSSNSSPSATAVQRRPADNTPTSSQPRTVQEAIARAEQPVPPNESGANNPTVASVNNAPPPTTAVQRRFADNAPTSSQPRTVQEAIARAEQSTAPSESSTTNPSVASNNPSPTTIVQRQPIDNAPTPSQPRTVQEAIARAEQSTAPSESGTNNPTVASVNNAPQVSDVQRRPIDNAPTSSQPRTVQEAIARAEQPAVPNESSTNNPRVASNTPPPTSAVQRRAADSTPTSSQPRTVQEAIARAEQPAAPRESGAPNPSVASNNPPPTSAVQRRPADNAPTTAQPRTVQEAIAHAEQPAVPSESGVTNPTVASNNPPSTSIQRTESFNVPYADNDPRKSAFDAAIARAESRPAVATADSHNIVQRVPTLEEQALDSDVGTQAVDLATALGVHHSATGGTAVQRQTNPSSQATSVEADLLRMLGKPANTPIQRATPSSTSLPDGSAQRSTNSASPEQSARSTATSAQAAAPANRVQRVISAPGQPVDDEQDATAEHGKNGSNATSDPADVERVAQEVYRILRQRLKVERERSQGKVH